MAVSPTKSGALNLILQRSKDRRGVVTTSGSKPMKVSDSTSDLVDNMEETAAETPVYPRQVKSNLNNLHNQIFFNNVCVF